MAKESEKVGLYGPLLGELLSTRGLNLPQVPTPSRNEIRRAIYTLFDPQSVSYLTFATILEMGRVPTCNHLELLASDACILPSCVKLLRKYCHVERNNLFDHAYGLLCVQTIVLSVQVATLLQTERLESFLKEIADKPQGSFIISYLHERVLKAEMEAGFGPGRRGTEWLLGWYRDEIAGRSWSSCLRQIGGFTINDAKFLIEQIWSSRADFLPVSLAAGKRYYGWASFLNTMWRIVANNYGLGSSSMGGPSRPQTPDERQCWIHFADISCRYALCSSEPEDTLMPAFLAHCPNYSQPWSIQGPGFVLGELDSSHIVQAFLTKLQSRPNLHIAFSSMLFGYVCKNIEHPDTNDTISQVFHGILERSWAEVARVQELNPEQFGDLLGCVTYLISNGTGLLGAKPEQTRHMLEAISDEIFIEFIGRFLLSPLLVAQEASYTRGQSTAYNIEPVEYES